MTVVRKNITITKAQAKFVKERNINLSRLVQKILEKDRDDWKFHLVTQEAIREMKQGRYKEQSWGEFRKEMQQWIQEGQKNSKKPSRNSTRKPKLKSTNKSIRLKPIPS